ncbi:MAG: penicillin-binding transpeptidase domain-containing protein [Tuberibacillus sp.]
MFPRKNRTINRWAAVLVMVFTLLFFVFLGRFVYLAEAKSVEGHDIEKLGKEKWTRVKMVDAERGQIIGSDGSVLAHDTPAYTLQAILSKTFKSHVVDKEKTAEKLAPLLKMPADEILAILNKDRFQVEFGTHGKNLSIEQMEKIQALKLPGLVFEKNAIRYYPNGSFAPYVIGFTNHNNELDKDVGTVGIEKSLNQYLTEQDGEISFYSSSDGVILPEGTKKIKKPHNGDNVYITIDSRIQTVLENAMSKVDKEYKPQRMIGIVADPKTGAILAMSNRPTFDPNERNIKNWTNAAISDPYEPGSVMKTFTLAAAMNENVWPGNQTYASGSYPIRNDSGRISATVHDWQSNWGTISFNEGFTRSSNVAFSIVEEKYLKPDRFYNYLERFGFTKKTGIDLPNESNSKINFKWKTDQVMNSFGQASAVTPIQIIQAATAIANDGQMVQPYVIQKVVDPNDNKVILQHETKTVGQPIKKETAVQVRKMMHEVVWGDHGTGHNYQIPNYDIIGKTGTAQLTVNGHLLTGKSNYIFSFLGMAPQDDPKLVVYIAIDRPHLKPKDTGSEPVAAVFKPVMENALQYMQVKPELAVSNGAKTNAQTATISQWVGKPISEAKTALANLGLNVITIGDGIVQEQSLYEGLSVLPGTKIILVGQGLHQMPDVSGWSLTEVLQLAQVLGMEPKIQGNGFVISQSPAKGSAVKKGMILSVKMQGFDTSTPSETKKNK